MASREDKDNILWDFLEWVREKDLIKLCYTDEQYTNSLDEDEITRLINDYLDAK